MKSSMIVGVKNPEFKDYITTTSCIWSKP